MEERIRDAVGEALAAAGAAGAAFTLERPTEAAHGDYATNAAMVAAKALGKNPRELAEELATKMKELLGDAVEKVEVAGPGFINITLAAGEVVASTAEAAAKGEDWGKGKAEAGKRVMIEYTQPNPFKEMHIGHVMGNTIGESVARLTQNEGATIVRANYQGDVGPHVAKALWGLQKAGITEPTTATEISEAYVAGNRAYEDDPEAKGEIDAINRAVYQALGDPLTLTEGGALMELWRKGRDVSLAAFEEVYKVLGTKFDYYFFESETAPIGLKVVRDGLARGVFEESEGAVVYKGEKRGLHTRVFITSQGTPTYEAKDMGLAFLKEERWPSDKSVVTTAQEQASYFAVILEALKELAPLLGGKTQHVPYGFMKLTTGKMSSREGNVITAASLIEDVVKRASEKNADPLIAEQVAVGAIKYMILRQAPGADIVFEPEKSLSLEGDSGPYLQYALVRAVKILSYESEEAGGKEEPQEPY
ncbi:MAG: arginine--tRNA ligase, partial [Patescibacteria group bacterium]|nr:arginine--tRNA ligase [Patescibacteria group bacterium]